MNDLEDVYELSPLQQGMLFHSAMTPEAGAYVVQMLWTLDGGLDTAAFRAAWDGVLRRHPILRTTFHWREFEKPLQVVHRNAPLRWTVEEWTGPEGDADRLHRFLEADRDAGFDLENAPPLRAALLRTASGALHFVFTHHHLLLDGWSLPLVLQEVFVAYEAAVRGTPAPPLPQPRPYRDYILWLQGRPLEEAEAYWRATLAGFRGATPLPFAKPARAAASVPDAEVAARVPAALRERLERLARQCQVTLNTVAQGAWALLLARCTGEDDVLFGATTAGRPPELDGVERMVGLFINALPVRARVAPGERLGDWLRGVQDRQSRARHHEHAPLASVHGWSEVPRGQPLFESLLVFESFPVTDTWREGGTAALRVKGARTLSRTNYPLTLLITPLREWSVRAVYASDRFEAASVERIVGLYLTILEEMAEGADRPLGALSLLSAPEREAALRRAAPTRRAREPMGIHQLVEAQAALTPHAVAVTGEAGNLTYAELDSRANRLARYLRARRGVGSETRVAVFMERSPELLVALLAIFKAGGAYVPIDPAHPAERNRWIMADSGARVLLTRPGRRLDPGAAAVVDLDAEAAEIAAFDDGALHVPVDPGQMAYIVYTSGSTGRPKGVMGVHGGAANFLRYVAESYALGPDDAVLQMAGASFDASFRDMIGPLAAGARVLLFGSEVVADPDRLLRAIAEHRPTAILAIVPSVLRNLLAHAEQTGWGARGEGGSLRLVLLSGEALNHADCVRARRVFGPQLTAVNQYGPTETTLTATFHAVREVPPGEEASAAPVGEPIPNLELYVLDDGLELAPDGVAGELFIAGAGVTRGYANRPALTADRFVPHPWASEPGGRMYRTGDLFRREHDGTLRFLGRRDQQVKVRGVRVEPGEVEAALRGHPSVRDAAVVALPRADGSVSLRAFWAPADAAGSADASAAAGAAGTAGAASEAAVLRGSPESADAAPHVSTSGTSADAALRASAAGSSTDANVLPDKELRGTTGIAQTDAAALRAFLRERLPDALVPEEYVCIAAIPRTPNGKLDRGALPLDAPVAGTRAEYEAPRTAVEEVLAIILAELLEAERVGRADDFFALGGHSLTAMRLAARVRATLRAELPLMAVFAHPTLREMAEYLAAHEPTPGRAEQVAALYLKVARMSDGEVATGLERETVVRSPLA